MGDRLTQLQDAADQLVHQFIACYYYIERRHELETFGPNDKIHDLKDNPKELDSLPPDVFQAGQLELARDLITKEQQIEYLISSLPGLDNSEHDQEQLIKDLEEELRVAEAQRLDAIKEKDEILVRLDQVLRSIRRN
ncbi:mediator complex, subunit Med21 [Lasiosphaeria miniovina]|uniref:Mediator of RNA polymerase II transcription subunit 21 n=1 Tax=Lasiosphaeria miniovina TaxID=1954250 RepID=A0AA40ALV3_9PEZI|nr:mediator complex, subunit Med21 [Lasiosphaeria miniovina]KAK0718231.1 mediator complex, subunit Med21 [Lasiosphaeria miniovina]